MAPLKVAACLPGWIAPRIVVIFRPSHRNAGVEGGPVPSFHLRRCAFGPDQV